MSLRVRFIQRCINILDRCIFYPKLKAFYAKILTGDRNPEGMTVVDVGSNRGQSIRFYLQLDKQARIFGFEPNVTLFKNLGEKYGGNSRITLQNAGVSSRNGKLLFYQNVMDETSSFEELNYDSEYSAKKARVLGVDVKDLVVSTYEVETITLGAFLDRHPCMLIDILKIDVEGHEYECLSGLFDPPRQSCPIRFIQLERHNDDMYSSSKDHSRIDDLLKANGFVEAGRIKHTYGDFYEVIYKNSAATLPGAVPM
jgi:FkbM family methyltransferase